MSFANIYYERKVATARPCYICKRPTETVLSTIKTEDYLYTCEGHLGDTGFATLIQPTPTGPSPDDIKKVISDYKSREAKKAESASASASAKDKDDPKADKGKDASKEPEKPKDPAPSTPPAGAGGAAAPAPTHRKFSLHRQIFDMRKNELRRKEMGVKAREVGRGLPAVPRGMF